MSEAQLERPSSPNDLVEIDTARSATSQEATAPPLPEETPSAPAAAAHQEAAEEESGGGGGGGIAVSEAFEVVQGKEEQERTTTTTAVEAVERKGEEAASGDESSSKGGDRDQTTEQAQQTSETTSEKTTTTTTTTDKSECVDEEHKGKSLIIERPKGSSATIGTSTHVTITETQEVSSTRNDEHPKSARSSARRSSYNSGSRSYAGGYQNYGLTHLPYKSNFEPSEDARRRADEFFKTLKL